VLLAGTILTGLVMGLVMERLLKSSRRGPAVPWAPATGRWHAALQKGTQAVSAAADSLQRGAEARGLSSDSVVETITGSRLGKYIALAGNRQRRKS